MSCPDAVRAELLKMTGVLAVTYRPEADLFEVRFESVLISLENIFAVVRAAGLMMGRQYLPEVVPSPPEA